MSRPLLKRKMIRPASLFALSMCLCGAHSAALARSGSDQKNAATWYWKAIEQFQRLPRDDWQLVMDYNPAEPPTPELRAALSKIGPAFTAYQRAMMQEYSDFGLDFSQGIEMAAPHLSEMRQIARAIETDAMVRMNDGDSAGAAQRLAGLYRSSVHFGDDGTIISSLVGTAVCALGDRGVQHAMDHAAFGPSEAVVLLREVQRLQDMNDPFNYIGAAAGDQELLVNWIDGVIDEPDAEERISQMLGEAAFEDEDRPAHIEQIAVMNREEFESAVAQMDVMTDRVIGVMMMDDPEAAKAAMETLSAEISAGEHGPLAILSSYWPKVLERKLMADAMLATRATSLREIVEEDVQPAEVANAAVWYRRAIEMIAKFEAEELELLREFSAEAEIEADEDEHTAGRKLEPLLALSQDVVDVLREGSEKRRCDFSTVSYYLPGPVPWYSPGMRDAFRLVHADALRLLRLRMFEDAADRFAIGYRMIAHLSADPQFVSSTVSHRALLESHSLLELAFEAEWFQDEHRAAVLAAFDRIDSSDVFGYLNVRRQLTKTLMGIARTADQLARQAEADRDIPAGDEAERDSQSAVAAIEKADDDALLWYLAMTQYGFRLYTVPPDEHLNEESRVKERERLASLHDVLDLNLLMDAWDDFRDFAQHRQNRSEASFHEYEIRNLNLLSDRRALARADLRATSRLLRSAMAREADEAQPDD